jgi:hypothetical protein
MNEDIFQQLGTSVAAEQESKHQQEILELSQKEHERLLEERAQKVHHLEIALAEYTALQEIGRVKEGVSRVGGAENVAKLQGSQDQTVRQNANRSSNEIAHAEQLEDSFFPQVEEVVDDELVVTEEESASITEDRESDFYESRMREVEEFISELIKELESSRGSEILAGDMENLDQKTEERMKGMSQVASARLFRNGNYEHKKASAELVVKALLSDYAARSTRLPDGTAQEQLFHAAPEIKASQVQNLQSSLYSVDKYLQDKRYDPFARQYSNTEKIMTEMLTSTIWK